MLARDWDLLLRAAQMPVAAVGEFAYQRAFEICWKSTLVLLLWAGIDYLLQRQKLERDLRMSKQELRDEYKESDGNPTVKARLRRLQRQMRRRRMLKDVEHATVVVTNPTHFAVALEYRPEMAAPVVVAKGATCWRSRSRRWRAGTKSRSSRTRRWPRRCIAASRSARRIPAKLYAAVAEILAFVYRAQMRVQTAAGRAVGDGERSQPNRSRSLSAGAAGVDHSRGRGGAGLRHAGAAAGACPRSAAGPQHHRLGAGAAVGGAHSAAGAVLGVSQPAAVADLVPVVAEPGQQPPHSAARQRRLGRRGTRDRGLRAVRGGRQLRRRLRAVPGADCHPVHGGEPRRGAHRRSHGALHPGCHAGQADGDRCRPQCRPDRREAGARAARAGQPRGRVLRRHGRRGALQPARFAGHRTDHRDQYHRRIPDRRLSARYPVPRGAEDLHHPDRRRWPGDHDSFAAGVGGRRHRGYARLVGQHSRHRCWQAVVWPQPSAVDRRRSHGGAGPDSRAAQDSLPADRRDRGAGWRGAPAASSKSRRRRRKPPLEQRPPPARRRRKRWKAC